MGGGGSRSGSTHDVRTCFQQKLVLCLLLLCFDCSLLSCLFSYARTAGMNVCVQLWKLSAVLCVYLLWSLCRAAVILCAAGATIVSRPPFEMAAFRSGAVERGGG